MAKATRKTRAARETAGPKNIELSFHKSGTRDTARYVSDNAACEEALHDGRWIGLYWSATGHVHRENVTDKLPKMDPNKRPLQAFELEIDGQLLNNRWDWVSGSQRPGARPGTTESVVELKHQVRPVTVKVVTRVDGTPVLVRYLEITNTGSVPAALASVCPWTGILWNQANIDRNFPVNPAVDTAARSRFSLGYLAREDWGFEGDLKWQPLPSENVRIERKAHGRSWGSPYYILRNEESGEMFFMALAWSGNFMAEFAYRHDSILSFRIGPLAPAPLRVIAPGETVISPEVHLAPFHAGMDQAVAQWHRHVRTSVLPPRPEGKEMYTIAARVVEEPGDWIIREVDIAAEMGLEGFMVDAGWYGRTFGSWPDNRGDWFEGSWLPGGIAGIREHTHKKGLLFGLWHEAEALSTKSEIYQEHPDWLMPMHNVGPGTGMSAFGTLNLGIPEAARYFRDSILRIVREHKLDFYKLDYNVSIGEGCQNLRDGYAESEFWRHMESLYQAYDEVLRECPNVMLENCAGGGGRNDLGLMSRFHYACESDWSVFPYSIRAINTLSLFLPPEALCYYHNHIQHAHQTADLDTHLRVTLFVLPIFVGFGAQNADRSTPYFQKARRYIELHKRFCRPVLAGRPVVYHHTPDIGLMTPADWCVLEYGMPDRSRGYAGVFRLTNGAAEYRLRLRGVDVGVDYEVTLDNGSQVFRMSGRELTLTGLPIGLETALTSELVLYRKIER